MAEMYLINVGKYTIYTIITWTLWVIELYSSDICECDISMKLEENVCNTGCGTQVCFGKLIQLTSQVIQVCPTWMSQEVRIKG